MNLKQKCTTSIYKFDKYIKKYMTTYANMSLILMNSHEHKALVLTTYMEQNQNHIV